MSAAIQELRSTAELRSSAPTNQDGSAGERAQVAFDAVHQVQLLCMTLLDHFHGDLDEDTYVAKACASRARALAEAAADMLGQEEDAALLEQARNEVHHG